MTRKSMIPENNIKDKIYTVRGLKVILDSNLAKLYEVSTKRLNEQVRRNIERFPEHFMFRLTEPEYNTLRCQNGTSRSDSNKWSRNVAIWSQNATSRLH